MHIQHCHCPASARDGATDYRLAHTWAFVMSWTGDGPVETDWREPGCKLATLGSQMAS